MSSNANRHAPLWPTDVRDDGGLGRPAPLPVVDQPPRPAGVRSHLAGSRQNRVLREQAVSSARTRIARNFDTTAVRQLKDSLRRDITVGGATLAAQAISAGLVDEYHLFVAPVVIGGGVPALPKQVHLQLELLDEHRCGNGVVHLHYRSRP